MDKQRALKAFRREPTDRIPHCEILSCPDAMEAITGIDPWEKPRSATLALVQRYALDFQMIPPDDTPTARLDPSQRVFTDAEGRQTARWGSGETWHWDWGAKFPDVESVLRHDPLEDLDFRWMDPVGWDLSMSDDELVAFLQKDLDFWREACGPHSLYYMGFYNTLFMWPLLTYGWENLLELGACYPDECKRILRDFAVLSRKVFTAWSRTDLEVVYSHDDICYQRGSVFSPAWLREFIYPYYEEFWGVLKAAGKNVFFVSDGNIDNVYDDVIACGADGCLSENFTNWWEYKRKYPDKVLIGGGDNQIVRTSDKDLIRKMVREMTDLGKDMPGYFYCVANHLPYDMPAEGVRIYLDACDEMGAR